MNVIKPPDAEDGDLAMLPRMHGSWQLSTGDGETATDVNSPEGWVTMRARIVAGHLYIRVELDADRVPGGSIFGADCWMVADSSLLEFGGPALAAAVAEGGAPSVLAVVDGYRPAGRPRAGTARLADVLASLGFQKLVTLHPGRYQGRRIPVDLELNEGRLYRVFIYPEDVQRALSELPPTDLTTGMIELLDEVPVLFWGIEYGHFAEPVNVQTPPQDRLIEDGQRCR